MARCGLFWGDYVFIALSFSGRRAQMCALRQRFLVAAFCVGDFDSFRCDRGELRCLDFADAWFLFVAIWLDFAIDAMYLCYVGRFIPPGRSRGSFCKVARMSCCVFISCWRGSVDLRALWVVLYRSVSVNQAFFFCLGRCSGSFAFLERFIGLSLVSSLLTL